MFLVIFIFSDISLIFNISLYNNFVNIFLFYTIYFRYYIQIIAPFHHLRVNVGGQRDLTVKK
ncbi:hypothetical protein CLOSTASPAR_05797 [[Clostridium] asparagiforme DSM 15981]|uniref:Uncharacterized protein n=1 Tax=[Clostridium] asparagiforme DSM 15981 TaxID=518636 RepID=C0D948_9FIRM|nr:hypothetical protein CLOSTASPAR_05797 [[Clostridium] asparagiforme DSM 15981]